jgi:hypothetical protein
MALQRSGGLPQSAATGLGVELLPPGRDEAIRSGPVASVHAAELVVPPDAVNALLTTRFMERVASAYRRFLRRISLGLLRVRLEPGYETLVLPPLSVPLLRFRAPAYGEAPDWAEVRWDIYGGLLVSGVGRGWLRIHIRRLGPAGGNGPSVRMLARMEVADYYPRMRGEGWFAPIGTLIYAQTQARMHRLVIRGFLRSLGTLELRPSTEASALARRGGA